VRSDEHEDIVTGVVGTSTGDDNTVMRNNRQATWADVVRKPAVTNDTSMTQKKLCGQELMKNRVLFPMRSFSRNNPVDRKV
jgi:hypothetical protein